jgi:hypothetical protein
MPESRPASMQILNVQHLIKGQTTKSGNPQEKVPYLEWRLITEEPEK